MKTEKLSKKLIQKLIKEKYNLDYELVKNGGAFYFIPVIGSSAKSLDCSEVCTYRLDNYSIDNWMDEFKKLLEYHNNRNWSNNRIEYEEK